ncbi:MAG TPA: hypothetical protein ENK06_09040 [Gammaproteobacteria bacterium]|nr:hypothetical protein [Gammaproteobacteria bacterium]
MPYLLFALLVFASTISFASEGDDEIPPQSSFNINYGYDSNKNYDVSMLLDFEFSNYQRFSLGYSKSKDTLNNAAVRYSLAASTSAYETVSIDAGVSYMILSDALEEYTFASTVNLNLENWLFSITPQLSAMTFFLNSNEENKFDIYAKGGELSAGYYGFDQFYFSANFFRNFFSRKPFFLQAKVLRNLNIDPVVTLLALNRIIELGSGLQKQRINLTVGRYFPWGSLDFTWSRMQLFNIAQWLDISELEQSDIYVNSYYGAANLPMNKYFSLDILFGFQASSGNIDDLIFTSAGLNYYW